MTDAGLLPDEDWYEPSPARAKRASPELDAQKAVVRFLRLALPAGSVVASIKNEEKGRAANPHARARFGQMLKASGVLTGMPDLVACIPGGRTIFIEMKAPKRGVLSTAQIEVHARLRAAGFTVGVARSIEEASAIVVGAGVQLRAHI